MSGDHLQNILARERVDMGPYSPVLQMRDAFMPLITEWAGSMLLSVEPSGSFAKGTAVRSGTDIDLFISLSPDTTSTLQEIHDTLANKLRAAGFSPKPQSVSIGIRAGNNTYDVDLVPARRWPQSADHSLFHRKTKTPRKTNIQRHIQEVRGSGRLDEIKLLKVWRNKKRIDFPSFYLELTVIAALGRGTGGNLGDNLWHVFKYLRDTFPTARVVDPAVPSNAVSDDLTATERDVIKKVAVAALSQGYWRDIIA
jgi:hypothetical protein